MIPTGYPYFRWWLREAEADEFYRTATDAEIGFYHRCLNRSWDSGGLPADPAKRAVLLGKTRAYADKMWKTVGTKFLPSKVDPSRLVNRKQEDERKYVHEMSERNSKAGKSRNKCSSDVQRVLSERSTNGLQHTYGSGSDSVVISEKRKTEVSELWSSAGFDGPENFDIWWRQVVSNHPNKNRNTNAFMAIQELITNGNFKRQEFEDGYAQLRESKEDDWTKEGGKFCTNLYDIIHDGLWKFKPAATDNWIRELAEEQALQGKHA